MKDGFIHVCFIVDKSGSMYSSRNDVIGGFKSVIDEQKINKSGKCAISLFTFNENVTEDYIGTDVSEITGLINYTPSGCTSMNDGIGTAITKIGQWLAAMPESERPEQNLIVIMTDGEENSSTEYNLKTVREMIKHQTDVYSWKFMYIGTDITSTKDADALGIVTNAYSTRDNYKTSYDIINNVTTAYRCAKGPSDTKLKAMDATLSSLSASLTAETESILGTKISK